MATRDEHLRKAEFFSDLAKRVDRLGNASKATELRDIANSHTEKASRPVFGTTRQKR